MQVPGQRIYFCLSDKSSFQTYKRHMAAAVGRERSGEGPCAGDLDGAPSIAAMMVDDLIGLLTGLGIAWSPKSAVPVWGLISKSAALKIGQKPGFFKDRSRNIPRRPFQLEKVFGPHTVHPRGEDFVREGECRKAGGFPFGVDTVALLLDMGVFDRGGGGYVIVTPAV